MSRKTFLGVTSRAKWLNLAVDSASYWCVFRSQKVKSGDLLALYKTQYGVTQIYEITAASAETGQFDCNMRGMVTVPIRLVLNMEHPVSAKHMKSNPVLCKSGPVGRNFQATCFTLSYEEWQALICLLSVQNPDMKRQLEELK